MHYVVFTTRTVKKPQLNPQFLSEDLDEAQAQYRARAFDLREITKGGGVVLVRQSSAGTEVIESEWSKGTPRVIRTLFQPGSSQSTLSRTTRARRGRRAEKEEAAIVLQTAILGRAS